MSRPSPHQWAPGPAPAPSLTLLEAGLLDSARRLGADGLAIGSGFPVSTALRLVSFGKGRIAAGEPQRFIAKGF